MKKLFKRKLLATFLFSAVAAVILIAHGIFFDADWSQIGRLTLKGFVFTFILSFTALVILERIFNLEDHEEIISIKRRLGKLEKKRR